MRNKVVGSLMFALGALVALTPRYILPVCEWAGKTSGMLCGWSGRAEIFIGIIIVSVGIGVLLSKGAEAILGLMIVSLVSGVAVIALPQVIGYCHSDQMPCHYGTIPLLRLLGGLVIIASLVAVFLAKGASKKA